ncbi:MAG: methionyl-tRNA formyltransferase, partial [Microcystaceae cyanobacterium]
KEIEIHNQVRGFYPNCFTQFRGQILKVLATIPLTDIYQSEYPPQWQKVKQLYPTIQANSGQVGEIVAILKNWGPVMQTGQGLLLLQEVQLAGKRVQSAWDWVNGNRLEIGEQLGRSL